LLAAFAVRRHPVWQELAAAHKTPSYPRCSGESLGLAILHPVGAESSGTEIPSPTGRELALPQKSSSAGGESSQGFSPQLSWSHYRALMRVMMQD